MTRPTCWLCHSPMLQVGHSNLCHACLEWVLVETGRSAAVAVAALRCDDRDSLQRELHRIRDFCPVRTWSFSLLPRVRDAAQELA